MNVFCVWAGLGLTIAGLIAALFYLPAIWSIVLVLGLAVLIGPLILDMRREDAESLRRFTPKPDYYWKGSSDEG